MHSYPSPAASSGAPAAQGVCFMILTLLLSRCCWHVRVFERAEGCMVKLQGVGAQVSGSAVCVIDCESVKPWPGCREMKTSWGVPARLCAVCVREKEMSTGRTGKGEEYSDHRWCWEIAVILWTDFLCWLIKGRKSKRGKPNTLPTRGIALCDLFTHTDNSLICLSNLKMCLSNVKCQHLLKYLCSSKVNVCSFRGWIS